MVLTASGLEAFQAAWPVWVDGIRHCFADVLSPEQLDSLAGIAEAIDSHYNSQHLSDPAPADGACEAAARTAAGTGSCADPGPLESAG